MSTEALLAGRDARMIRSLLPALRLFNRRYLRLRQSGTEHLRAGRPRRPRAGWTCRGTAACA